MDSSKGSHSEVRKLNVQLGKQGRESACQLSWSHCNPTDPSKTEDPSTCSAQSTKKRMDA